jgi:hypothetical protein
VKTTPEFEGWAIVELMGHRKLAGYVREVTIAGAAMLRLDIPAEPPLTQYYGASSLYCLTPTTEDLAKKVAQASRPAPVSRYELPEPPRVNGDKNAAGESYENDGDVDGDDMPDDGDDDCHHDDVRF